MSVEDIILNNDRRGISKLRGHLPANFTQEVAQLILDNPGHAVITTGFYIFACKAPETDGPPGAIAIGKALKALGYNVTYVTDRYTAPLMTALVGKEAKVVDFPISDHDAGKKFASKLLKEIHPTILISIERCGLTKEGTYHNMRGIDITQFNAKVDYMFDGSTPSVGIGDGGNEIGMGNLASIIPTIDTLPKNPCVTKVDKLVITSVSNWGGYGVAAAISLLKGKNLLLSVEEEQKLVKRSADMGAVDGILNKPAYGADGFPMEEHSAPLRELHALLKQKRVS